MSAVRTLLALGHSCLCILTSTLALESEGNSRVDREGREVCASERRSRVCPDRVRVTDDLAEAVPQVADAHRLASQPVQRGLHPIERGDADRVCCDGAHVAAWDDDVLQHGVHEARQAELGVQVAVEVDQDLLGRAVSKERVGVVRVQEHLQNGNVLIARVVEVEAPAMLLDLVDEAAEPPGQVFSGRSARRDCCGEMCEQVGQEGGEGRVRVLIVMRVQIQDVVGDSLVEDDWVGVPSELIARAPVVGVVVGGLREERSPTLGAGVVLPEPVARAAFAENMRVVEEDGALLLLACRLVGELAGADDAAFVVVHDCASVDGVGSEVLGEELLPSGKSDCCHGV